MQNHFHLVVEPAIVAGMKWPWNSTPAALAPLYPLAAVAALVDGSGSGYLGPSATTSIPPLRQLLSPTNHRAFPWSSIVGTKKPRQRQSRCV
jgi:hypothetical protein